LEITITARAIAGRDAAANGMAGGNGVESGMRATCAAKPVPYLPVFCAIPVVSENRL
jgi:hypothetical protein